MIKLVVTDIDGTILGENNTFRPRIIETVERLKKAGIPIVLATGRVFAGVYPVAKQLGIDTPIICSQGSIVRHHENMLWERPVKHEIAREVIEVLREKGVHTNVYTNDMIYVEDERLMDEYTTGRFVTYELIDNFDNLKFGRVSKLLAITHDEGEMVNLCCELSERYKGVLNICRSHKYYLEFTDIEATKGSAMRHLADLWGIKQEEIFASGDNDNDVELLLNAGIRVATDNATDALKRVAQHICPHVDLDGWADAIEKFVLEGVTCE